MYPSFATLQRFKLNTNNMYPTFVILQRCSKMEELCTYMTLVPTLISQVGML